MPTDEERRDVARRLRDSAEERMAVKGTGNGNNWSWLYRSIFGHYMGTKNGAKGHYVEVAHRLADLIEPSDSAQTVAEDMFGQMRHSTEQERVAYADMMARNSVELHPVDRDALLALADEMTVEKGDIWGWSRRIREALGGGRWAMS